MSSIQEAQYSKFANKTKKAYYFPDRGTKICGMCKEEKDVKLFWKHRQTQDGYHTWCIECTKRRNKETGQRKYNTFLGRVNTLLTSCKGSALSRGQEMTLTREQLCELWESQEGICAYSGKEMTLKPGRHHSVSIERVDNKIGYTISNCVLVCKLVNSMKSNFDYFDFVDFCKAVAEHQDNLSDFNRDRFNSVYSEEKYKEYEEVTEVYVPVTRYKLIEVDGITKDAQEWSEEFGVNRFLILNRLRRGWTPKDAIQIPAQQLKELTIKGVTKSISQWAKDCGLNTSTLRVRIREGWDEADLLRPVTHLSRTKLNCEEEELTLQQHTQEEGKN